MSADAVATRAQAHDGIQPALLLLSYLALGSIRTRSSSAGPQEVFWLDVIERLEPLVYRDKPEITELMLALRDYRCAAKAVVPYGGPSHDRLQQSAMSTKRELEQALERAAIDRVERIFKDLEALRMLDRSSRVAKPQDAAN